MTITYSKQLIFYLLFIISPYSLAQTTQNSHTYFPRKYSEQPIITFKEGFFNKTTYYLDGEKTNPKEVGALLNSMQNEDFEFLPIHRKKSWGAGIMLTGLALNLGSIAYLFTNEITPAIVRPWYLATLGGGIMQFTGNSLIRNGDRRIQLTLNDFNAYHFSGGTNAYLSMDVSDKFLGPQIDFYEGPMLLQKHQVLSRFQANDEAFQLFERVLKRQKVSTVTNIVNSALGFGVMFVAVGFERQSSSQNNLLIPMTLTGIGLNIFSSNYERRTRNLTREALHRYNYQ
jgi:hypothetical protein